MLNLAIKIAVDSHRDQIDKGGNPYILHPLRVMLSMNNESDRICALLHDVIEDSVLTFDDLRNYGFTEELLQTIECLTKRVGEPYESFVKRVLADKRAIRIKIADIEDNMDLSRISNISEADLKRVKKYEWALSVLKNSL